MDNIDKVTALPPGTRLEKYELLAVLGQGGGGITYSAVDHQLEREVVLKEHFPMGLCRRTPGTAQVEATDSIAFERSLQSFCREARILGGLRHPGVVPVHEFFGACGTAFLVMAYAEGESLSAWLASHPATSRIQKVLFQLLDVLEYVHTAGVVHRDIKPENIIIQEDDSVVLIDFGAAFLGTPTHTLTLAGTPAYAAPEQFEAHTIPDARADIYALGQSFLLAAEKTGARLPRCVQRTLEKATQKAPDKRFANAAEWKSALSRRPNLRFTGFLLLALAGIAFAAGIGYFSLLPEADKEIELVDAPGSPYHGLPVGAPLHPIQMVHYGEIGQLIRYNNAKLAPAEEAFVSALLEAQKRNDEAYNAAQQKYKDSEGYAHKLNWVAYMEQKKLNNFVVELINSYMKEHYRTGDPYAQYTQMLIDQVREANLAPYRPILNPNYRPSDYTTENQ